MPEVMPVFVIKSKDKLAVEAVECYRDLCAEEGLFEQAAEVEKALEEIRAWQEQHPTELHLPNHKHVPCVQ